MSPPAPAACPPNPKEIPQYASDLDAPAARTAAAVRSKREEWIRRARAWLSKRGGAGAWRAKRKKRSKALQTLRALNHQLKHGLDLPLRHFRRPAEGSASAKRPLTWPTASWCCDSGPDIVAAFHFVSRHEPVALNIDFVLDLNHLCWNAAKRSLKAARLWGHQLLMLLSFLMRHGPFNQASRLQQCKQAFGEYLQVASPQTCPLFDDLLPRLLRDRHREKDMAQANIQDEIWSELAKNEAWDVAGTPVNLNRWFHLISEGRIDDRWWNERFLSQLYTCLELDLLAGKKFEAFLDAKHAQTQVQQHDFDTKPMMKDQTAEARQLKASCANLLVVSTMVRADPQNQNVERLVCGVLAPFEEWVKLGNKQLRDAGASIPWVQEQLGGKFFEMVNLCLGCLSCWSSLRSFGFSGGFTHLQAFLKDEGHLKDRVFGELVAQDEFAVQLGELSLALCREVVCSWLWLLEGWPQRAVLWLTDAGEKEVAAFLSDAARFDALEARVLAGDRDLSPLYERSVFRLIPVKQLRSALSESGGKLTDDLKAFLRMKFARFMQSQVPEDGFNLCRRVETLSQNMRAPVHTLCNNMFTDGQLAKRHRFGEVQATYTTKRVGMSKLPPDAFRCKGGFDDGDLPYGSIASNSSSTPWWKCRSEQWPSVYCDLVLMRMLPDLHKDEAEAFAKLSDRWLSCLLRGSHVVRRISKPIAAELPEAWFFALGHDMDSACLLWPATTQELPGCPGGCTSCQRLWRSPSGPSWWTRQIGSRCLTSGAAPSGSSWSSPAPEAMAHRPSGKSGHSQQSGFPSLFLSQRPRRPFGTSGSPRSGLSRR